MTVRRTKKPKKKIEPDPALIPFLDEIAAMIAERLLAEYRKRKRQRGEKC